MLGQPAQTGRKHLVVAIAVGLALASLIGQMDASAMRACGLLERNDWILTTILRPVYMAACRFEYLAENSICSATRAQIASSIVSSFRGFAGLL